MRILGIESSCDETGASVVELTDVNSGAVLLSNEVSSSMDLHAVYGGVVPEIAARSHIEAIIPVIDQALANACPCARSNLAQTNSAHFTRGVVRGSTSHNSYKIVTGVKQCDHWSNIDGIAVTYGAGLGGSLLVGVMTARTLAITKNKPLYAINHVEAHVYANFITSCSPSLSTNYELRTTTPAFPMLGLIVSGGHSQLVLWRNHFDYTLLGQTQDDAIGEAFDKVAKIIGLPYPGGPSIEKFAKLGNPNKFDFPKAKMPNKYDYSFSGPKTAVLRCAQQLIGESHDFPSHKLAERLTGPQKADIAASFQQIAVETVVDKTMLAFDEFHPKSVVIGGGVAASPELRRQLADRLPIKIDYTDMKLCTDNGAMIATLGAYSAMLNQPTSDPYSLEILPNLSM